jgi:3-hydroxyisobutyrate dehydrogenase-like beta-hydroxyacid dehydrogenase
VDDLMAKEIKIGFIGLGAMGFGMASNILAKHGQLGTICNRSRQPVDDLVARGAVEHADAAALAAASDVVILCLPNSEVVERVVAQMGEALSAGKTLIDTGTSSLPSTEALAAALAASGIAFAEAPLTGGIKQAEAGELGAMVGASDEVCAQISPVLAHCCAAIQHFGPVGAGARAKFVNNYMVFGIAALVFEAFHIADLAGADWAKLYDLVIRGSADSGVFRRVIGGAIQDDYKGYVFDVNGALKDMRYNTEMNSQFGRRTALNEAVLDLFERAQADGLGDLMISELMRPEIRERRGGV